MHFFAEIYRDPAGFGKSCERDYLIRANTKSVASSNGLAATHARFPSFLFSKNVIWPLMMANFLFVSEKSASKMQMCSRKPLSGRLHDLLMRSVTRSCNAVFGSGYGSEAERQSRGSEGANRSVSSTVSFVSPG